MIQQAEPVSIQGVQGVVTASISKMLSFITENDLFIIYSLHNLIPKWIQIV